MRNYPVVNWTWPNKQEVAATLKTAVARLSVQQPWLCLGICQLDPAFPGTNKNWTRITYGPLVTSMVADIYAALNSGEEALSGPNSTLWAWMLDQGRATYGPAELELVWRQEWVAELLADLER